MKLFKKMSISSQNQLRKYIFVYIVAILFSLLTVFVFFGNLNNILRGFQTRNEPDIHQRVEHQNVVKLAKVQADREIAGQTGPETANGSREAGNIVLWGHNNVSMKLISEQLENMKEEYRTEEELQDCQEAEILFVCTGSFTSEELGLLQRYNKEGITLFFTQIPDEELLTQAAFQNLLGIESYDGIMEKTGVRFAKRVLFGDTIEKEEDFSMKAVTLDTHTEVYIAALEENEVDVEDLSPMFWRYKESVDSGDVYVAEQSLLEEGMGYGIVSFFFTDIYQIYIYPVINAYCFMIKGMPYTDTYTTEFLSAVFQRDSMGVQNDIFFPEISRCEERYAVKVTWYSGEEMEQLGNSESDILRHNLSGLEEKRNEMAHWNPVTGLLTVDSPFENQAVQWSPEFEWIDENNKSVNIPYHSIRGKDSENIIYDNIGMSKGIGINTIYTDIESFLNGDANRDREDWVRYCRNLETALGVEREEMNWLERVTVGEAIYRIQAFSMMEPEIEYSDSGIDIKIGNFTGKAFFYLALPREIKSVENAEITEIFEDFYMIEASKEHVSIIYEEEKG